jgi:DNA gyrase inhibitor GyrI
MKSKLKFMAMIAGLGTSAALIATGCGAVRGGYESAPYQLVRASGAFEVCDYPAITVVETPMAGGGDGSDGSFNRLFRFITGDNKTKQKIAMTTPVFMSGGASNGTMAFVMPAKMKAGEVPTPSDGSVTVRELPAGRFAVLRYSGGHHAKNEAEALAQLRALMKREGLQELSPPIYGYFDPPWTPAFLRRNEVMVGTGAAQPSGSQPGSIAAHDTALRNHRP